MNANCIFCKIVDGEIPAEIVHSTEEVVAFRDLNPQAPSHVLVIPRKHIERIADLDPGIDSAWMADLFAVAVKVAESEGHTQGFRLVMNNGEAAGQTVDHVHLHVLGGRSFSWPPG